MFKVGLGRTWLDIGEFNNSIEEQGFQAYTNQFKFKPASIETSLRLKNDVFGIELASHDNLNSDIVKNDFQNNVELLQD